jgi:hypothetical protein
MNMRLNPLYKKLLLISLVLGPIVWLVFTEDGQRRSDLVVLYLFGYEELNLAIENLNGNMTEAEFRELFPDLKLVCEAGPNPFGDRLCAARVGSFSGIPARAFTLFMDGRRLRAAKLDYRPAYHAALARQLNGRLGTRAGRSETGKDAVAWSVSDGLLLMPAVEPREDTEAALIWLSAAGMAQRSEPLR